MATDSSTSTSSSIVPQSLDDYFQSKPIGSIEKAIINNLYGVNHRQIPGMVPMNKDTYGLTFFVRPQLNLQSNNIRNARLFYPLLSELPKTIQRFVRCTLDPRLAFGHDGVQLNCPMVDPHQAFIPVLTNNLVSISGWPDFVAPTYSSDPGNYEEVYSQVDGHLANYKSTDITATFRNTKGDPILYMFYIWLWYQSLVFEGVLVPYPDYIVENALDYNTRIYRLVLDESRRYVKKIGATGVSFPISVPVGQFFDFSNEKPYNDQAKDITIQFRSLGFSYMDDILVHEFNSTVEIFHPGMRARDSYMVKVHPALLVYFNNRGYPRINPVDYELEWWVDADLFSNKASTLISSGLADASLSTQLETSGSINEDL